MKIRSGFVSNSSSSSFAIIGFEVTDKIRAKIKEIAMKNSEMETEEFWACRECGFEPGSKKVKFCEKCGGAIETSTREVLPEWTESDYELFEAVGMSYYSETEDGEVAGFNVGGESAKGVIELNNKLIEMLGDLGFYIFAGEYAC